METIKGIKEISECKECATMIGYEVITDEQSIKLLIDDEQDCCERYGYFWCNDKPNDFIGASLRGVTITDSALSKVKMEENELDASDKWLEGSVMFVNLETDRGMLQFVAYNEHNGYYGHEAKVTCKQLKHSKTL